MKLERLLIFFLVLIAFGLGFNKANSLAPATSFAVPAHEITRDEGAARFETRFASSRLHTQSHAASLIELKDGRIRAFWFSGSREGAPDVEVHTSVFDPNKSEWSAEQKVIDRLATQHALQRFIGKLGNPVAGRAADGSLRLFYVTVSLGGWGGSSITTMESRDEGETWSAPRRLITSPFLNFSTLVRSGPVQNEDGSLALPVYHEFVSKFGELLRIGAAGEVVGKQRLAPGGSGTLQPVLLVRDAHEARALMRHAGESPRRVVEVDSWDGGQHWSEPGPSPLPNPDAALSAIILPDGRLLAALNNIEQGRDALSLMISADGGANWKLVYQLEDQREGKRDEASYLGTIKDLLKTSDAKVARATEEMTRRGYLDSVRQQSCAADNCRYEFSYPYLIQARDGEFHLVYTWQRALIKHVRFNQAWLDAQLGKAK